MTGKNIYISVINDLVTDQRVQRIAGTLKDAGFRPVLIGRRFRHSPELRHKNIEYRRFRLLFNRGFLFYASYNVRLFLFLLSRKEISLLVSNDLDTLPANFLVSRIRKKSLVYDSHEYFTEVPELIDRKFVKRFWEKLEKFLVPKVDFACTVNETLAKLYSAKYGIAFHVIRNLPDKTGPIIDYHIPDHLSGLKLILYQGSVNRDRGLEEMMELLTDLPYAALIIAGDGDVLNELKLYARELNLEDRIFFAGRLCPMKLKSLTSKVHLGISLEKKTNMNYFYALPNKLFDYIQACVPIVCSGFPEMKRILDEYEVGISVDPSDRGKLKKTIEMALNDEELRETWKRNCQVASEILSWKNEQKELIYLYKKAGMVFPEEFENKE